MTCGETNKDSQQQSNKRSHSSLPNMEQRPLEAIEAKKAKIEVTLASSEAGQLGQIESEFQILKSLIPDIANRQQINEVCEKMNYFTFESYFFEAIKFIKQHPSGFFKPVISFHM